MWTQDNTGGVVFDKNNEDTTQSVTIDKTLLTKEDLYGCNP